jgi:hypothetical protein
MPFNSYKIQRGQTRGLGREESLFSFIKARAVTKLDESGQISTKQEVG